MRSENARCRGVITCGLTVLMICIASALPSSAQAKAKPRPGYCASDTDLAALNARVLQTELMVAALSCDEKQRYNSFVTAYREVLRDRGQALQISLPARPRREGQHKAERLYHEACK